jgi:hypothetical protein
LSKVQYVKQQGKFQLIQIEDSYDYTKPPSDDPNEPETEWYHRPLAKGPSWLEPFFGTASDALLTLYGVPFYRTDPETLEEVAAGIVMVTISLDDVRDLIASLDLGATGYGYVLSKDGLFIAHPIKEFVGNVTIFELADSLQDEELRAEGESAIQGQIFSRDTVEQVTGQSSWIFHEPISSTGWSIGIVLNKNELAPDTETTARQLIGIALSLMAFLLFLSVLLFRADRGSAPGLWKTTASFSVLCILGMAFVWHLASSAEPSYGVKIFDQAGLDRFLASHSQQASASPPTYIPTGVFIQTVRFPSPNEVGLSGYIWQKYADSIDEEIARGFVLPQQAGGVPRPIIEKAFHRREGDVEIIGWHFMVTLRQPFDPSKYPFDHQDILLRLRHEDFDKNVILTPDLDAYELINPTLLPGLDDELVLKGWLKDSSFFSYQTYSYNANFGLENFVGQQDAPELCFNIGLRRNFVDPFIAYLVPLSIVACMMFALLIVSPRREAKDVFSGLSYAAAMFFVIAMAHNGLRGKIAAQGMTYLEYFYIVMYVTILTVSLSCIMHSTEAKIRFIRYRDGLIPQLLYWPAVLGMLLVITLLIFYP